jgi:UDP-N-acetylmuramate dehydrogenase
MTVAPLPPSLLAELNPYGRQGVQRDVSLAPHTSFRIGGPAASLLTVERLSHLVAVLDILARCQVPFLILGGGTNLLVSDAGVPDLVVLNHCRQITWPAATAVTPEVRADSGAALAGLARSAIKRRLAGLAWAASVPGTVGGAVVGNAGAHGGCIADNLQSARLWEDGRVHEVAAADLQYAYRRSRLKGLGAATGQETVVLAATFHLQVDPEGKDAALAEQYIAHRRHTQPVDKSAGSIFKNPTGDYAGRLIEALGLKGFAIGGAAVSPLHANFIVNRGDATAADVVRLINHVRTAVYDHFAVVLEPEILFVGDWSSGPQLSPLPVI